MKKSKSIKLLFVTGILAACSQEPAKMQGQNEKKVYMRSDSTASYSSSHGFMTGFLLYHAFVPMALIAMELIKDLDITAMLSVQNPILVEIHIKEM